jgi:FkbM family methyltransferase
MRRKVRNIVIFFAGLAFRLRRKQNLTDFELFVRNGYDRTLLEDIELDSSSICLDFGGYTGEFTARLNRKYSCEIHVFEPIEEYFLKLQLRFSKFSNVKCHNFAVGRKTESRTLQVDSDSTGEFATGEKIDAIFKSSDELTSFVSPPFGLIAMNIEGGEYELIEVLHASQLIRATRYILVQFHNLTSTSLDDRAKSRLLLMETHKMVWNYDFVWELWELDSKTQ